MHTHPHLRMGDIAHVTLTTLPPTPEYVIWPTYKRQCCTALSVKGSWIIRIHTSPIILMPLINLEYFNAMRNNAPAKLQYSYTSHLQWLCLQWVSWYYLLCTEHILTWAVVSIPSVSCTTHTQVTARYVHTVRIHCTCVVDPKALIHV